MSAAEQQPKPKSGKKKCLTCSREAIRCGLCIPCYQAAYREMKEQNVTRQQLEEAGLILPPRRGQRPTRGPWRKKAAKVLGGAIKKRRTDQ